MESTRTTTPRRRQGGFTLLEVVISMGILAIVLLGMCSAMLTSALVNEEVERDVLLNNALRKKIEEIKSVAARVGNANDTAIDNVYYEYQPTSSGAYQRFDVPMAGMDNILEGEAFEFYGFVIPHTNETHLPGGSDGRDLSFYHEGQASKVRLAADGTIASVVPDDTWYDLNGSGTKNEGALSTNRLLSMPVEVQVYRTRHGDASAFELVASQVVLVNR